MKSKSTITWLHLSDFHLRVDDQWNTEIVTSKMLDDIGKMKEEDGLQPDFIAVTGDIAFSGKPKEYALARDLFDQLLSVTGLGKDRLFVVPGNHDVDRKSINRFTQSIAASLTERDAVNEIWTTKEERNLIFARLRNYDNFIKDYFQDLAFYEDGNAHYVKKIDSSQGGIFLIGLNSAWLCGSNKDLGTLVIGEKQTRDALREVKRINSNKTVLRIGLVHHPFDWLQEFDQNDSGSLLMNECHFILRGHLHQPSMQVIQSPDSRAMIIGGGAAYTDRKQTNAYNMVRLDTQTGKGTVFLRRYSDQHGGFYTWDVESYRNVDNGRYDFAIPLGRQSRKRVEETKRKPEKRARSDQDKALLLDSYLSRIIATCNDIPIGIIDPKSLDQIKNPTLSLSSVYIALNTREKRRRIEQGGTTGANLLDRDRNPAQTEEKEEPVSALEAVNSKRRLVVLGNPGIGKSTFVNALAMFLADACLQGRGHISPVHGHEGLAQMASVWTHGSLIPLKITLRFFGRSEFCNGTAAGLWKYVFKDLADHDLGECGEILKESLRKGGLMILFDGLDEVVDPDAQKRVRQSVQDFANTYSHTQNHYMVTCRGYAYQDIRTRLKRFETVEIASFNQKQINAFIVAWYGQMRLFLGQKSLEETESLISKLQEASTRPDLLPLAENPLQLTMMASLHFTRGNLPEARAKLYDEMVDLLLVRWQEGRLAEASGPITHSGFLKSALETLAFQIHEEQQDTDSTAEMTGLFIREVLEKECTQGDANGAKQLLSFIGDRAGLLIDLGTGRFTFPHRSYQEFLAASYLVRQRDFPNLIAKKISENLAKWREVCLWSVGIVEHITRMRYVTEAVIRELSPQSIPEKWSTDLALRVKLAGECILEARIDAVHDEACQRIPPVRSGLVQVLNLQALSARYRVDCGRLLGRLGDPRFNKDLWYLPHEPLLGFVEIPTGSFLMGSNKKEDLHGLKREFPQHEFTLERYYISRYPVTVAQFQIFLEETKRSPKDLNCLNDPMNYPVRYVSWHEALAYGNWLTRKLRESDQIPEAIMDLINNQYSWQVTLPSEAEWERAARGADGRLYPWGNRIDGEKANYEKTRINDTSAVGCFPRWKSQEGCLDMAGNVFEWTRNNWGKDIDKVAYEYPYNAKDGREDLDDDGSIRIVRGGSFWRDAKSCRCAYRGRYGPSHSYGNVGFRVVLFPGK